MRRGFTLIELMVVVGIMAFLGVAATGGYSALQRGMAERAAVAAASSLLDAARERSLVDRSPTVVFCYNRMLSEATDTDNAIVVGEAVAVRRAGRVTYAQGNYIVDEFMDVVGSYDVIKESKVRDCKGMKLWRFDDREMSSMQYSVVADAVVPVYKELCSYVNWVYGLEQDQDIKSQENDVEYRWCNQYNKLKQAQYDFYRYAFYNLGTSSHEPSRWVVGNGYGFEFAKVQLPKNFIFERSLPTKVGDVMFVKALYFSPDNPSVSRQVSVYRCVPSASGLPTPNARAAGTAVSSLANSQKEQTL